MRAGKTTICAGLAKYLQSNGKKAGFLRINPAQDNLAEAALMKQFLNMDDSLESLYVSDIKAVKSACNSVSEGRDVVIAEGKLDQDLAEVVGTIGTGVIVVETYAGQTWPETSGYKKFGNLLGVVLNRVPLSQLKSVETDFAERLDKDGIKCLGVIPEDRLLFTITVGDLAERVQGLIVNNEEKSGELLENVMLGAMVVDSGLTYFGRKDKKAAIIRSDRPDMQLAALETSNRCLVLSGSRKTPNRNVMQKAQNSDTPVIVTDMATDDIIASVESALAEAKFSGEKKLSESARLVREHLNLKEIKI